MNDENYVAVILEDIRSQNKAVLEAVGQIQETVNTLASKVELQDVADDVKTIKQALTETNRDIKDIDQRVALIEQAA